MYEEAEKQHLRFLKHKHPDCIPIYFVKHKDASASLKDPTTSLYFFIHLAFCSRKILKYSRQCIVCINRLKRKDFFSFVYMLKKKRRSM